MRADIANTEIAKTLDVQHTTVSRYRSGDRVPSLDVMLKIAEEYDWGLELQALSRQAGTWHEGFEAALATKFGEVEGDDDERPSS
jgi:transcriptional regulator with XRE-family HTH domain